MGHKPFKVQFVGGLKTARRAVDDILIEVRKFATAPKLAEASEVVVDGNLGNVFWETSRELLHSPSSHTSFTLFLYSQLNAASKFGLGPDFSASAPVDTRTRELLQDLSEQAATERPEPDEEKSVKPVSEAMRPTLERKAPDLHGADCPVSPEDGEHVTIARVGTHTEDCSRHEGCGCVQEP